MHHVCAHRHAAFGAIERDGASQAKQARFRGAVGSHKRGCADGNHRADIDDGRRLARGLHRWKRGAAAQEWPFKIDIDGAPPTIEIDVDDVAGLRDASDVAQHVELAEMVLRGLHCGMPLVQIAHVEFEGLGILAQLVSQSAGLVDLYIAQQHFAAFGDDHPSDRGSDPLRTACDECDFGVHFPWHLAQLTLQYRHG